MKVPKSLLHQLMMFNQRITGISIPSDLPSVRFVSQKKLNKATKCRAFAAYDSEEETILLPDSWENDVYGRHLLVHELIHHMQYKAGQELAEEPAYKAMFMYVAENVSQYVREL